MTAPSYGCFGCVDVFHNARTQAYVTWACSNSKLRGDASGLLRMARSWCSCDADQTDEEILQWGTDGPAGHFVDTDNPHVGAACWYDPLIPESEDFLGVVLEKVGNLRSSTTKRETADGLIRGTVLLSPTFPGKQMVFEVLIIATSISGQNYGIQWLRRQFEDDQRCPISGSTCASCQGQLLTLRVACPTTLGTLDNGLHTFPAAGIIDGFVEDEERFPLGRSNCEKALAGTMTLVTETPDSYSTNPPSEPVTIDATGTFRALGNCIIPGPSTSTTDPRCPVCNTDCDPCRDDPACDCQLPTVLVDPNSATIVSACFTNAVCRCIASGQVADLPSGYDTALRLTMDAGWDSSNPGFQRFGMRNAVVRIWERDPAEEALNGIVMPTTLEQYDLLASRLSPCAELGISWIPAGAQLIIDGLSGRSWLLCEGRCRDHSARVHTISGTVFPLKARCQDLIVTVEWDCLNVQTQNGSGQIPTSLTVESFLGYNL